VLKLVPAELQLLVSVLEAVLVFVLAEEKVV
jgi:hypothetical protein